MYFKTIIAYVLTFYASFAFSIEGLQKSFIEQYPSAANTKLNSCATCHTPAVEEFLNPYAIDLRDNNFNFDAIESKDSDLDGISNIAEINNGSNPGSQIRSDGVMLYHSIMQTVAFHHDKHVLSPLYRQYNVTTTCDTCHTEQLGANGKPFRKLASDQFNHQQENAVHFRCVNCHTNLNTQSDNIPHLPTNCNECHNQGFGAPIITQPIFTPTPIVEIPVLTEDIPGTIKIDSCSSNQCFRHSIQNHTLTNESGNICRFSNNSNELILYNFVDFDIIGRSENGLYQVRPRYVGATWTGTQCETYWTTF